MITELIWAVAKDLISFRANIAKQNEEQRTKFADLIGKVADCIQAIATMARNERRLDSFRCRELLEYMLDLTYDLKKLAGVRSEEIEVIHNKLHYAVGLPIYLDRLFEDLDVVPWRGPGPWPDKVSLKAENEWSREAAENLKALEECGGYFRATANLLRAR